MWVTHLFVIKIVEFRIYFHKFVSNLITHIMKNSILFGLMLICTTVFSQVGINNDTSALPNGAAMLDVESNDKGVLIPRLTSAERDANLADNDIDTVPPAGVTNTDITEGLLIFNTDVNAFEYWDGELWRRVDFNTPNNSTPGIANDGAVVIYGSLVNGQTHKQSFILYSGGSSFGTPVYIEFANPADLVFAGFPTTSWPANEMNPGSAAIYNYSNNDDVYKFRENGVPGQVHIWRLIVNEDASNSSSGDVKAVLTNPNSGFSVSSISPKPGGGGSNVLTFYFYTIADEDSLEQGEGYRIFMQANNSSTFTVEALTRISLAKD